MAQVLELDPYTFAPTLSLKYGSLVLSSASTLCIKLHPFCLPGYGDEDQVDEDWEEEAYEGFGAKPKFGQPVEVEEAEDLGVWEGDWGDVRRVE